MKTILCALTLLLALPLPLYALGKGHGVEVRAVTPLLTEVEPGSVVTGSFLVTNSGGGSDTLLQNLQLPAGWSVISPQVWLPFVLEPREQKTRIVAFRVPPQAAAGRYRLAYSATSQREYGRADNHSFEITVLPLPRLQLSLVRLPSAVREGEPAPVLARISNQGNSDCRALVEVAGTADLVADREAEEVALAAGESVEVRIAVRAAVGIKEPTAVPLTIGATVLSAPEAESRAQKVVVHTAYFTMVPAPPEGKGGIEVQPSPLQIKVYPGSIVSGSFRVSNIGCYLETISSELRLPTGWKKVVHQGATAQFQPGEHQVRMVAVSVPADAAAETYHVVFASHRKGDIVQRQQRDRSFGAAGPQGLPDPGEKTGPGGGGEAVFGALAPGDPGQLS